MGSADVRRCSMCGAGNPSDARWCGQCFGRFEDRSEEGAGQEPVQEGPVPPPSSKVVPGQGPPAPPGAPEGGAVVRADLPDWACPRCGVRNPLEAARCSACGADFFEVIAPPEEPGHELRPSDAALWGLAFPGLGHRRAGQQLLGLAIGLLVITTLIFGGVVGLLVGSASWGWLLVLLAVGLWAAAALDAYQFASGRQGEILLRPRVVSVAAGLSLLLFLIGLIGGVGPPAGAG